MVSPVLTHVITALASAGIVGLILRKEKDGSATILQGEKPIVNVPSNLIQPTLELPIVDSKVFFRRISAPTTKGTPQINLINAINGNRLYHISFIPDATFKATGALEVSLNNSTFLDVQATQLTDTDALSIPIPPEGIEIKNGGGINVNAWDSGSGSITVLILTGVK